MKTKIKEYYYLGDTMKGLYLLVLLGLLVFLTAVPQPARLSGVRPLGTNPFLVPTLNLPGRLASTVMVQLNSSSDYLVQQPGWPESLP